MVVSGVLRNRRRYNGNVMAVYPPPEEQTRPPRQGNGEYEAEKHAGNCPAFTPEGEVR